MSVVNLKCGPLLTASLRGKAGYFPAYHMNKANWITAALDESAAADEFKMLLDVSFAATAPKGESELTAFGRKNIYLKL